MMIPESDFEKFNGLLGGKHDCCFCEIGDTCEGNLEDVRLIAVWTPGPGEVGNLCFNAYSFDASDEAELASWEVLAGDVQPADSQLLFYVRTIELQRSVLRGISLGNDKDWITEVLENANLLRARHGANPLQWSPSAAEEARKAANKLAAACDRGQNELGRADIAEHVHAFEHGYGEASHFPAQNKYGELTSAKSAINHWYSQLFRPGYDFNRPGKMHGTAGFTQLVWTESTHIGMDCDSMGKGYIVACYSPPGNINGLYAQSVNGVGSPSRMSPETRREIARARFEAYDLDGNHRMSCIELEDMLRHLDPTFTRKEVQCVMKVADKDGNGHIDFREFLNWACASDAGPKKRNTMLIPF